MKIIKKIAQSSGFSKMFDLCDMLEKLIFSIRNESNNNDVEKILNSIKELRKNISELSNKYFKYR